MLGRYDVVFDCFGAIISCSLDVEARSGNKLKPRWCSTPVPRWCSTPVPRWCSTPVPRWCSSCEQNSI
jgi:hypothetical protein